MSFDAFKIAPVALAAMIAASNSAIAQEAPSQPEAPSEQESTQSPPEAQTTPGVDDTGDTQPPVPGSSGPGYGNSAEPEAAPAQPPIKDESN